jgi:ribose transport system permease protein
MAISLLIGLLHGLLITKLKLQPFVVTLCGLLFYRGYARYITDDQVQGFGSDFEELKQLTAGKPCTLAVLIFGIGCILSIWLLFRLLRARKDPDPGVGQVALLVGLMGSGVLGLIGAIVWLGQIKPMSEILVPMPFFIMTGIALLAGIFLNGTIYGRYLLAVGRNERAARYSGINTDGVVIAAYVICSLLAGIGGVLFSIDINSVQPSSHGNFYELYAIAAAVLGGFSLRGGEGSILGVIIGAAVMRVLYNSINLLGIPTQLEFAIIGGVILVGVIVDELVKRLVARRQVRRQLQEV